MEKFVDKLISILLVILLIVAILAVAAGFLALIMIVTNLILGTKLPWMV